MLDIREASHGVNILILGEWNGVVSSICSTVLHSCVEGGGARGLSSLVILGELVARLQHKLELTTPPDIREHFDIVAGTGTGAVIACLVGRLGLPVYQAMTEYAKIAAVFSEQKFAGTTTYSMTKLQKILKSIVEDATGNENTSLMDESAQAKKCQIMVFAMSKHNMNAGIPVIFRSYHGRTNQMPNCPIWQVLSATMAHPGMFKPVEISSDLLRQNLVDGGLGCNNPTAHVLAEVKSILPGRHVSSVVCIGAGHPDTIQLADRSMFKRLQIPDVLALTKGIALDAERVANEMDARFRSTSGVYFRFSVDQGLQNMQIGEWEKLSHVWANAQAYMRGERVSKAVNEAVIAIERRALSIESSRIDGEIQLNTPAQPTGYKVCPAPTAVFTGRQDIIDQIIACISKGDNQRCVFVLYGLGGAGKTQLALKTVEQSLELWTDVVFVDATSSETAENALAGFAKEKGLGESHLCAVQWLGNQRKRWLMVIDNADDPSVQLSAFLPHGNHGSVVITTRISALTMLGRGANPSHRVANMTESEGRELLLRKAGLEATSLQQYEQDAVVELLQASPCLGFGYLALAIAQAGAYARRSECTIDWYRDMFAKNHQRTLEERLPVLAQVDSYHKTVYTTWHMNYQQLSINSRRLLCLMSFMHYANITEEIFQRSAIGLQSYEPEIPATGSESAVRAYVTECLKPYLDSAGSWDSHAFRHAMADLLSYSLINFDRANDTFTIHVLVHDWASTVLEHPIEVVREHTALLLAASIDYEDTMDSLTYKRLVEVHVTRLLESGTQPTPNNAVRFSQVYYQAGKREKELELDQIVMAGRKERLGEEHDATLTSMNDVAVDLHQLGQYERALALQEQVVDIRKRVSGSEHSQTLVAMRTLASTYYDLGRYTDAQSLHQHILDTSTRVHGHDHPDTLWSMHDLALTYQVQGQYDQAEALLLKVVDASKRVSGDEHPETLTSMHALAYTYYRQGRYDEAESMQEHVVEVKKHRQGDDHPDTLNTMGDLALTYFAKGRYGEAEELQRKELEASKRVYGEDHPETLTSMNNLGYTYYRQGRYEQAEELQKRVVEERGHALGAGHPRRLRSMRRLLNTYHAMGESRHREYDTLQRQIKELESRAY
ncbi:kinesin light chain [Ceratobasidium sp. AG-Ba]|nr:kinesin light chain [Ceratobasidium sp. AG-Ba]